MAEPTPGRPGQPAGAAVGPRSATAATFQVNDKSLKDLHLTWRNLIKDVKDFNAELQALSRGGKAVDQLVAKLGQLGVGGGRGGVGAVTSSGGGGGRMPGMPPVPVHLGSTIPVGNQNYRPPLAGEGGVPRGAGGTEDGRMPGMPPNPNQQGGRFGATAGKVAGAALIGAGLFYARRMDDISDADLFFNQQAQNTGGGYRGAEKSGARNTIFGRPGGNGFGGGITGYQSVQDALGGARNVFGAVGGSIGTRGMAQLRSAGQLAALTPDMGLTASGAAVGSLYDPTTSARMASVGMGPSVGMRGQLQSPQAIYQHIIQTVFRGRKPTAQMITEGLQPGANLYLTLTQGLGLTPDAIEQFARYAIAQANLGGNAALTNRAINAASRGQAGNKISSSDRALVKRAGLDDNIRSRQNELGGAQARQTIEAGREAEGALEKGFSKLADATDILTNTFKRLNDVSGGASGNILGGAAILGGPINSALNAVGGVGGGMFAWQSIRQMRAGKAAASAVRGASSAARGAAGAVEEGAGALGGTAEGAGGFAARAGGFLGKWGTRLAKVPLPALGSHVYKTDPSTAIHRGKDGHNYTHDGRRIDGNNITDEINPDEIRTDAQDTHKPTSMWQDIKSHFAAGGVVPGNHNRDDVDIRATPGEVVVPKTVVHLHGGAETLMRKLGFHGRGRDGHYADGGEVTGDTKGLNPDFFKRLKAWSAYVGQPFNVGSGYRSIEEQKVLYDRWMRKVPGQAKAAKPGSSNHNYGLAADGPHWRDKHPEKFGLRYPMSFEPWHVEPANAKAMRGGAAISGAVTVDTSASDGAPPAVSPAGGTYVTAPRAASDEKSAFAAWMANSTSMYGINETPTATTQPPKSGGIDSTPAVATTNTAPSDPSGNAKLGQQKAAARGWTGSEWDALYNLFQKESGWQTDAANGTSSARGIAQTMMSVHFGKDWKTSKDALDFMRNPSRQIDWGLNYIAQRYTTPSKAWAHSQKFNWYDTGAWQTENETAVLHKDEMVVPAPDARKLRSLLDQRRQQAAMPTAAPQVVRERGTVQVSISMPVQLVGKATPDDAKQLVKMMKSELEQDRELAALGGG